MLSHDYSSSWQHDISVARRAILQNPDNPIAYYVLVKGVEVRLTQQVLDAVAVENDCVDGEVDVFAGVTPTQLQCLQQDTGPGTQLILVAQHFRDYALDEAEEVLSTLNDSAAAGAERYYFAAIQSVLSEDAPAIQVAAANLRSLPASEERTAALFLAYYQLGNLEAANILLGDVLEDFDRSTG